MRRLFQRKVRVGVYVDGFNLYYGARDHCGRGKRGWRWLDVLRLAESMLRNGKWRRATVTRLVYCTAMRSNERDPSSMADQETYLTAIMHDPRSEVVLGKYAPRRGKGILVRERGRGKFERILSPGIDNFPDWMPASEVRDQEGRMQVMVRYSSFEEKGSDVNLATHLIRDIYENRIDAAIIISNDGDLTTPIKFARDRVMVGLVNPGIRPTAETLKGDPTEGRGGHWWHRLTRQQILDHQLDDRVGDIICPPNR